MANVTTKNPMVLDTAAEVLTTPAMISAIVWVGYSAAGDDLLIKDSDGNTIIEWKAPTVADTPQIGFSWADPIRVRGFNLVTIDAGKIMVHLK